jgi:hypothetical protein
VCGVLNQDEQAMLGVFLILLACFVLFLVFTYVIHILFLLSVRNTLREVAPERRECSLSAVWLTLIPIGGQVWNVWMVRRIHDSLVSEIRARGLQKLDGLVHRSGLVWAWSGFFAMLLGMLGLVVLLGWNYDPPILGDVAAFFALIYMLCGPVYWVSVAEWGRVLRTGGKRYQDMDEADYDEEYQPRHVDDEMTNR